MGRIIKDGDTQVINRKTGQKRFFSDALISNQKFMDDNDWEVFETPDIPQPPTYEMSGEPEKTEAEKAEDETEALATNEVTESVTDNVPDENNEGDKIGGEDKEVAKPKRAYNKSK